MPVLLRLAEIDLVDDKAGAKQNFDFDDAGLGNGTMAAAAKVKSGGTTGAEVDDYSAQPVKIRVIKAYS